MTDRDRTDRSLPELLQAHRAATATEPDVVTSVAEASVDSVAVDTVVDDARAATPVPSAATWDPQTGSWVDGTVASEAPAPTKKRSRKSAERSTWRAAIAGGIVGAIVATLVAIPVARWAAPDAPVSGVNRQSSAQLPSVQGRSTSIVDIAAQARPWVVNIDVSSQQQTLFGSAEASGTGSGIILKSDGHILTNAHVVEGATSIKVTLASGDEVGAKLIGADPETDIAVIKVNRNDLPAAVIGSVKDVQVGDTAIAIGSPLGLEQSVTAGIISALGRRVDGDGQSPLFDMIQTDAAITLGNSGGALVDAAGAVIGVNTAIASVPQVGGAGAAFAIPIDVAVAVAEELSNSGRATHPWLGVTGGNITPETAKEFGTEQGAFIREVVANGPAAKAGLKPNDVVVEFAGQKIESMDDLVVAIREHDVGESVPITIFRDGKRQTLTATLGDKPS